MMLAVPEFASVQPFIPFVNRLGSKPKGAAGEVDRPSSPSALTPPVDPLYPS